MEDVDFEMDSNTVMQEVISRLVRIEARQEVIASELLTLQEEALEDFDREAKAEELQERIDKTINDDWKAMQDRETSGDAPPPSSAAL